MSSAVVSECACTARAFFLAHGARRLSHPAAFFAARPFPKGVKARAPCAVHPQGSSTKLSRASLSPTGTRVPVA